MARLFGSPGPQRAEAEAAECVVGEGATGHPFAPRVRDAVADSAGQEA
ncbi:MULTISPECIES: hypothetical protein [unclassified Streptomyces]